MSPYGKRGFVDVTELRVLRWGDDLRLFHWALNAITSILIGERQREAMRALKQEVIPLTLKAEEGSTSQEIQGMQANSGHWKQPANELSPQP